MSRMFQWNRGLVLALLAVSATAVAAACTPPMPPDVLAARAEAQIECFSGDTAIGVPDSFLGSMSNVGLSLSGVCPEQTVTEVAVGDPSSRVVLTDAAPSTEEIEDFKAGHCPAGEIEVVPAFGYPVTIAYNVPGLEGLVLTPEAVAGILSGSIVSLEDAMIAEENPGVDLSGLPPITLLAVDQPQGAVEAMTGWLAQQVPQVWTEGSVGTLQAATPVATHADLLVDMTVSESTVSVLPIFDAFINVLATANLPVVGTDLNGSPVDIVVTADDVQLYKVGSGATVAQVGEEGSRLTVPPALGGIPNLETFDLASSKIVLGADQPLAGWPVVGYAHLLVCDDPANPLPRAFAQYLVRLAGQGAMETFGLTPLPEPIRIRTFAPLKVTVNTDEPIPSGMPGESSATPAPSAT